MPQLTPRAARAARVWLAAVALSGVVGCTAPGDSASSPAAMAPVVTASPVTTAPSVTPTPTPTPTAAVGASFAVEVASGTLPARYTDRTEAMADDFGEMVGIVQLWAEGPTDDNIITIMGQEMPTQAPVPVEQLDWLVESQTDGELQVLEPRTVGGVAMRRYAVNQDGGPQTVLAKAEGGSVALIMLMSVTDAEADILLDSIVWN